MPHSLSPSLPPSHLYIIFRPQESCRIKYIGRNCRVVLVGGILLKAEQEVAAGPGTKVILNFNNKVCRGENSVMCCVHVQRIMIALSSRLMLYTVVNTYTSGYLTPPSPVFCPSSVTYRCSLLFENIRGGEGGKRIP